MSPSGHTVVSTTSTPSSSSSIAIGDDDMAAGVVAGVFSCVALPVDCEEVILEALDGVELESIASPLDGLTFGVATLLDVGTRED